MRLPLLLIPLLLAGCDDSSGGGTAAPPGDMPAAGVGQTAPADPAAVHREKARQALAAILPDAERALYSDVRGGAAGAVCGRVDANQADGGSPGPRPFVVTPEGVGLISSTAGIRFEDPEDLFPDFYIRWCATPEELRRIGPRIAAENTQDLLPPEEPAPIVEAALPPEGPPAVMPEPTARAAAPPPTDEDSFSRAVLRNGNEGAAR